MNFEDFWGPCYLTGQDLGLRAEEALAGHQAIVGKIWNEDKGGIELEELERNQGIYDGYMRFLRIHDVHDYLWWWSENDPRRILESIG